MSDQEFAKHLTSPEVGHELHPRDQASMASLPKDVKVPESRVAMGHMLMGKSIYIAERDRKRCERTSKQKT